MAWPEHHLELLCVVDRVEARASRLWLDRRAEWASMDVSLRGCGFRGVLPDVYRDDYWLYEGSGARVWMHYDNERAPARPLVFVLEMPDTEMEQRRPRSGPLDLLRHRHVGDAQRSARQQTLAGVTAAIRRATDHPDVRTASP